MYYHNYERQFLIFSKVEYSTYHILSTLIFGLNLNLDHRYLVCLCVYKNNQYGTYKILTLLSGSRYFRGGVTSGEAVTSGGRYFRGALLPGDRYFRYLWQLELLGALGVMGESAANIKFCLKLLR